MTTLVVQRPGLDAEPRPLLAAARAGGSLADDIHLPGCPPAAIRLLPCAAGVVVEAGAPGVRVGGHAVAAGARRLLRPGESAELHGATLALPAPQVDAPTRAAAAALVRASVRAGVSLAGPHLVVLSGPSAGLRFPLGADQTLGRSRRATIVLPDPRASRLHARLRVGPDGATVEDLRSKNGLRVNGVPVDRRPVPLRSGDELVVGDTCVAVELAASAAGGRSPRPPRRRRGHAAAAALLAVSAAALAAAAAVPP